MKRNNLGKRLMAVVLCIVFAMCLLPSGMMIGALAAEDGAGDRPSIVGPTTGKGSGIVAVATPDVAEDAGTVDDADASISTGANNYTGAPTVEAVSIASEGAAAIATEADTYAVSITVVDSDGAPIINAAVSILKDGAEVPFTYDAISGTYAPAEELPAGEYTIVVTSEDYKNITEADNQLLKVGDSTADSSLNTAEVALSAIPTYSYALSVTAEDGGVAVGSVTVSGYNCNATETLVDGSVTFTLYEGKRYDFTVTPTDTAKYGDLQFQIASATDSVNQILPLRSFSIGKADGNFTVAATANGNTVTSVKYGTMVEITVSPNEGYHLTSVNGTPVTLGEDEKHTYPIESVTADVMVTADTALVEYTLTTKVDPENVGTITVTNAGNTVVGTITYDKEYDYTVEAVEGYEVSAVKLNDVDVLTDAKLTKTDDGCESGHTIGVTGTFQNPSENQTISATFQQMEHTVILGDTEVKVSHGNSYEGEYAVPMGQTIASVTANEGAVTDSFSAGEDGTFTITVPNITTKTTVTVTLEAVAEDQTLTSEVSEPAWYSDTDNYYVYAAGTNVNVSLTGNLRYQDNAGNTQYAENYFTITAQNGKSVTVPTVEVYDAESNKWKVAVTGQVLVFSSGTGAGIEYTAQTADKNAYSGAWTNQAITVTVTAAPETVDGYEIPLSTLTWNTLETEPTGTELTSDGSFTIAAPTAGVAATHYIHAVDVAGVKKTIAVVAQIETMRPVLEDNLAEEGVTYTADGKTWAMKDASIVVTATDANSGVASMSTTLGGEDYGAGTGDSDKGTIPYADLGADNAITKNEIKVKAKDNAGNEAEHEFTVFKDTKLPDIEITTETPDHTISDENWYAADTTFTITLSDEGSGVNTGSIKATVNGNPIDLERKDDSLVYTWKTDIDNQDGQYVLSVTVQDNVGNEKTAEESVWLDKNKPTIEVGEFSVKEENKVLNFLTFGIFGNAKITGTVSVRDEAYSAGINTVVMNYKDLEETEERKLSSDDYERGSNYASAGTYAFSIPVDKDIDDAELYFESEVSFTVTDNVGRSSSTTINNTTEGSTSNVVMVETVLPEIEDNLADVTYNDGSTVWMLKDVDITVDVTDQEPGSGISSMATTVRDVRYEDGTKQYMGQTFAESFNIPYAGLGDADVITENKIVVNAKDNAGNEAEHNFTVYKDDVLPVITENKEAVSYYDEINEKYWVKTGQSVEVNADDQDGSGVASMSTTLGGEDYGTGTGDSDKVTIPYADLGAANAITENVVVTVDAKDNVGNEAVEYEFTVNKDDVKPTVEITTETPDHTISDENWYAADTTFTITLSDEGSGVNTESIKATVNGNPIALERKDDSLVYIWTTSERVHKYKFDLKVTVEDNVGNVSALATETVYVDYFDPNVEIRYDNTSADSQYTDYYDAPRTLTIQVTEQNFNPADVALSVSNTDGTVPRLSSWKTYVDSTDPTQTYHEATLYFSADGDYEFSFSCTDYLGHNSNTVTDSFTIDQTLPQISVSYDNNAVENESFFKAARTATITIVEHNFTSSRVNVTVTAVNGNKSVATPVISGWSNNGNIHTATIVYDKDADYTFDISARDMAGNQSTGVNYGSSAAPTAFTVDLSMPSIVVNGIGHQSANNGDVIGFTVSITDKNLDESGLIPYLYVVKRSGEVGAYQYETLDLTEYLGEPTLTRNAAGEYVYTYTVENLPDDGYYSIEFAVRDLAGNVMDSILANRANPLDAVCFSVNRDGSVFWIETEHAPRIGVDENGEAIYGETLFNELDEAYVNGKVKVIIHEVNVDPVDETVGEETVFTLNNGSMAENIELVEGENYTKNSDAKTKENFAPYVRSNAKSDGWYETIYTLDEALFDEDGTYSLNVVTYDNATNRNTNTAIETGVISFVVDRTAPVITSNADTIDVRKPIKADEYAIEFKVTELNLAEETLVVVVNGEEIEPTVLENGNYQFVLGQKRDHEFTISVQDKAGNEAAIYTIDDLTVTTNPIAIWFENKALFWSTVAGAAVIAGIILIIIAKKSKKEEEQLV